jgi:HPt (histidine-containing phosphotransfer) domain-containing protein
MIKRKFGTDGIGKDDSAETETITAKKVCDLRYLTETMGGKKHLIKELIDVFLKQVPRDLSVLNDAVAITDYSAIRSYAHTIKSSVSIMGISALAPILNEMEELAKIGGSMDRIKELNEQLNSISQQAIEEIETEKHNYA